MVGPVLQSTAYNANSNSNSLLQWTFEKLLCTLTWWNKSICINNIHANITHAQEGKKIIMVIIIIVKKKIHIYIIIVINTSNSKTIKCVTNNISMLQEDLLVSKMWFIRSMQFVKTSSSLFIRYTSLSCSDRYAKFWHIPVIAPKISFLLSIYFVHRSNAWLSSSVSFDSQYLHILFSTEVIGLVWRPVSIAKVCALIRNFV